MIILKTLQIISQKIFVKILHISRSFLFLFSRSAAKYENAADSTTDDHDDSDEEDGSSEEGNAYYTN